jgi:hypothetical protein
MDMTKDKENSILIFATPKKKNKGKNDLPMMESEDKPDKCTECDYEGEGCEKCDYKGYNETDNEEEDSDTPNKKQMNILEKLLEKLKD